MAIDWILKEGNLIELTISGQLDLKNYQAMQTKLESVVKDADNSNLLILLKNFSGWSKNEGWGDVSAHDRIDPYINKMAIVGDEKWQDLVEVFTLKGLRSIPIEYYSTDNEQQARDWLAE